MLTSVIGKNQDEMGQRRMQTDFQGVFKLLKNNICDLYDIRENTKNCTFLYKFCSTSKNLRGSEAMWKREKMECLNNHC